MSLQEQSFGEENENMRDKKGTACTTRSYRKFHAYIQPTFMIIFFIYLNSLHSSLREIKEELYEFSKLEGIDRKNGRFEYNRGWFGNEITSLKNSFKMVEIKIEEGKNEVSRVLNDINRSLLEFTYFMEESKENLEKIRKKQTKLKEDISGVLRKMKNKFNKINENIGNSESNIIKKVHKEVEVIKNNIRENHRALSLEVEELQCNLSIVQGTTEEIEREFLHFRNFEAFRFSDFSILLDTVLTIAEFNEQEFLWLLSKMNFRNNRAFQSFSFKLHYNEDQNESNLCHISESDGSHSVEGITNLYAPRYVTTEEPLPKDRVSFFKVQIKYIEGCVGLGLIGTKETYSRSYFDDSSYLWISNGNVWMKGYDKKDLGGWTGFEENDEVYFKYNPTNGTITMKVKERYSSLRKLGRNVDFVMKVNDIDQAYIHIHLCKSGDRLTMTKMQPYESFFYFGEY